MVERPSKVTNEMTKPGTHVGEILLLYLGVAACATSVIFIKQSTVHPALVPAYRLAIASLLMAPAFFRESRKHAGWLTGRRFAGLLLGALLLALHFIAWTAGARLTPSTNGTLLVNLAPVVMPFILFFQLGERLTRREWTGTALSFAGILWLAASDYRFDRAHCLGDLLCFVAMLLFAFYLVIARVHRDIPSIWLYSVPLYAMAALISLALAAPFAHVVEIYPAREYLYLGALALLPTIGGHTLVNRAMRNLRGQTVTLATSTQFIFAGVLAAAFLGEKTPSSVYPAAALVAAGALVVILSKPPSTVPAQAISEGDAT